MRCGVVHDGNAQIHMFIANISPFLAVNLLTGGAFMNSSGKCVLFSCFAQTCRYVQGFKMLGGDVADLGPESLLGCELRQEGQGQVGVEKDICLGVPVALSKVSIFL